MTDRICLMRVLLCATESIKSHLKVCEALRRQDRCFTCQLSICICLELHQGTYKLPSLLMYCWAC